MGFWNELVNMPTWTMVKMWFKFWGTMALAYLGVLLCGLVVAMFIAAILAVFAIGAVSSAIANR
ncbi:Uncharacterised protein [Candidatus Anstonella stagnisolia]|nr:Uncharacterised protein [Candidatus Anstonella stagnisolia]